MTTTKTELDELIGRPELTLIVKHYYGVGYNQAAQQLDKIFDSIIDAAVVEALENLYKDIHMFPTWENSSMIEGEDVLRVIKDRIAELRKETP